MYKFDREAYDRRMEWYRDARFGMFIHWGLYAIPARGEWVRSTEQIPKEDYMKYFEEFNPVDFEPRKWAKAAKEAGMKYMVLTAKHHDGFCLFDSQYTDFKSTNTKCGRDLVAEYVDAVRAEGLKVGCISPCSTGSTTIFRTMATGITRCGTTRHIKTMTAISTAT